MKTPPQLGGGCTQEPAGGEAEDRPALRVACLKTASMKAALISTTGSHCRVWRSAYRDEQGQSSDGKYTEFVIKYPNKQYDPGDARILAMQHRMLRKTLREMVPASLVVRSCIEGRANLFVVAEAVDIWFNIANPTNRDEAVGLLRNHPIALDQLNRFIAQARRWRGGPDPRVIDLYGLDNLVMTRDREIRYVDSYFVFFFEDMLHLLGGEPDLDLASKIDISLQRLAYIEDIALTAARPG